MATITYIEFSGTEHHIDVDNGTSIMQGAVDNLIEGISADCGGCCNCATCHVIVDSNWYEKIGDPNEMESELLEALPEPTPTSRLSCQITASNELDGLIVRLPKDQA